MPQAKCNLTQETSEPNGHGPFAIWLGFAAGILNGLIGIGGGIVMVPGLLMRLRASPQIAVGTSLATVCVLSAIAFFAHMLAGSLTLSAISMATVIVSGAVGTLAGAGILKRLDRKRLLILFSLFLAVVSTRLIAQGLDLVETLATWSGEPPIWAFMLLGFASGVLSGVFGVGGGALVVLSFAVIYGMPVQQGLPLALAINVTNALSGSVAHVRAGRVLWKPVMQMIPSAIVGIAVGTAVALWLPANALRIVFGAFFLFMAVRLGRESFKVQTG